MYIPLRQNWSASNFIEGFHWALIISSSRSRLAALLSPVCGLGSAAALEERAGRCHLDPRRLLLDMPPFPMGCTGVLPSPLRAGQAVVWIDICVPRSFACHPLQAALLVAAWSGVSQREPGFGAHIN